jgi:hypothetical protein
MLMGGDGVWDQDTRAGPDGCQRSIRGSKVRQSIAPQAHFRWSCPLVSDPGDTAGSTGHGPPPAEVA